jgi:hypothetical protein
MPMGVVLAVLRSVPTQTLATLLGLSLFATSPLALNGPGLTRPDHPGLPSNAYSGLRENRGRAARPVSTVILANEPVMLREAGESACVNGVSVRACGHARDLTGAKRRRGPSRPRRPNVEIPLSL